MSPGHMSRCQSPQQKCDNRAADPPRSPPPGPQTDTPRASRPRGPCPGVRHRGLGPAATVGPGRENGSAEPFSHLAWADTSRCQSPQQKCYSSRPIGGRRPSGRRETAALYRHVGEGRGPVSDTGVCRYRRSPRDARPTGRSGLRSRDLTVAVRLIPSTPPGEASVGRRWSGEPSKRQRAGRGRREAGRRARPHEVRRTDEPALSASSGTWTRRASPARRRPCRSRGR